MTRLKDRKNNNNKSRPSRPFLFFLAYPIPSCLGRKAPSHSDWALERQHLSGAFSDTIFSFFSRENYKLSRPCAKRCPKYRAAIANIIIRLLAKVHLIIKMALFGIFSEKFFNHMNPYAFKISRKICSKIAHFSNQSDFHKKSI
jgi:hypothetical protein